jgi:hypothetical protein
VDLAVDNAADLDHRAMDLNGAGNPLRHDRRHLIAFVTDTGSEQVLRTSLSDMLPEPPDIRRGGIRAAHAAMLKTTSPRILVVDISGEEHALKALSDLATVVEPDVCVLVIGEHEGMEFYREITRGLETTGPRSRDPSFRRLRHGPGARFDHRDGRPCARGHRRARRLRRQFDRHQPGLAFRGDAASPHRAGRSGSVSW